MKTLNVDSASTRWFLCPFKLRSKIFKKLTDIMRRIIVKDFKFLTWNYLIVLMWNGWSEKLLPILYTKQTTAYYSSLMDVTTLVSLYNYYFASKTQGGHFPYQTIYTKPFNLASANINMSIRALIQKIENLHIRHLNTFISNYKKLCLGALSLKAMKT